MSLLRETRESEAEVSFSTWDFYEKLVKLCLYKMNHMLFEIVIYVDAAICMYAEEKE